LHERDRAPAAALVMGPAAALHPAQSHALEPWSSSRFSVTVGWRRLTTWRRRW